MVKTVSCNSNSNYAEYVICMKRMRTIIHVHVFHQKWLGENS